jgi:hypothetical protein
MAFGAPADAYTATDLAAIIPEVWSPIANEPKFDNLTILPFVRDLSGFMSSGGDIVHVPGIYTNTFTPGTQTTQGAALTDESVAMDDDTLTVNTHKYIAYVIGDKDMAQIVQSQALSAAYAREMRALLLKEVEDDLFALWSSLSTTAVGDTTTVLSDYEIRKAIETMETNNFELDQLAFFVHPTVFWLQLSGITKYFTDDTSRLNHIKSGGFGEMGRNNYKGHIYNVPVWTSTRVVGALQTYRNMLLHPDAFAVAFQTRGGGQVRIQSDYRLANLATLVVADVIYGVAAIRADAGVVVNANTSAVTS